MDPAACYSINPHGRKVCKVVLTGGPCAGKTTAMQEIADQIKQENGEWQCFTVSEASSFLYTGRVQRSALNEEQIHQWQHDVLKTILQLESVYDNIAELETQRHTLIICDRGGMDPKAYTLGEESWALILRELGTDEPALLGRYHLVVQMHTAPREFYSTANNPYRRENFAEASAVNAKYQALWERHPAFHSVDNFDAHNQRDGWARKRDQVLAIVRKVVGQ